MYVSPKKSLGQHFLTDRNIAEKIVLSLPDSPELVLEIGPGTGVLSRMLLDRPELDMVFIETDAEAVEFLHETFPRMEGRLFQEDFLKANLNSLLRDNYQIIGNLPYNISSQIFFRMLEDRDRMQSAVVMIQKEVAERIKSPPGSKVYGILSVLLQTWYDIEYLFTVSEKVFKPPPKVKSAVIRLTRNTRVDIGCKPEHYFAVVKAGFNQRRKTLRNSLKALLTDKDTTEIKGYLDKRAEQLSVKDFVELANYLK